MAPSATNRQPWEFVVVRRSFLDRRRKLLVLERTGWGKSLIYFIGTRMLRDRVYRSVTVV